MCPLFLSLFLFVFKQNCIGCFTCCISVLLIKAEYWLQISPFAYIISVVKSRTSISNIIIQHLALEHASTIYCKWSVISGIAKADRSHTVLARGKDKAWFRREKSRNARHLISTLACSHSLSRMHYSNFAGSIPALLIVIFRRDSLVLIYKFD